MIRHICMFKLAEENKEDKRVKFMEATEMLKTIPDVVNFNVVENSKDAPQDNYDVSLIIDVKDAEGLAAYSASKPHQEFKKAISDLRIARACIDHEF